MIISANGIVFDQYSDVLLIQRDDTRTFAPPGGACELNELPPDAAAREVREETGLIVYPVRLVGLYFLPVRPRPYLFLCFRCIQRGGELTTSDETHQAGFFGTNPLAVPMLAAHRRQVIDAFNHRGGSPLWADHELSLLLRLGNYLLNQVVYPYLGFRRRRSGAGSYTPPPAWQVKSTVVLFNENRRVYCTRNGDHDLWQLPTSTWSSVDSPWSLATEVLKRTVGTQVPLSGLSGIYLRQDQSSMEFVFTANTSVEESSPQDKTGFVPIESTTTLLPVPQAQIIKDASDGSSAIHYRMHVE